MTTMLYTSIRPGILTLVNRIMGTQGDCVAIWKDQPNPYTPPGTKTLFKLSLGPLSSKGADDEARWSYDPNQPAGQEMQESITGYRLFTLKVLCECADQTDGATAFNYLETLRTRRQCRLGPVRGYPRPLQDGRQSGRLDCKPRHSPSHPYQRGRSQPDRLYRDR